MMYKRNVAVALKVNGKVLREDGENVYLPFGSEYEILIKNLDASRRMKAKVFVDGKDAGDGAQFIVHPGKDLELERTIANGNMDIGNKFKFVERTPGIEAHRGVGVEDGLVRVEFDFELKVPELRPKSPIRPYIDDRRYNDYGYGDSYTLGDVSRGIAPEHTFTSRTYTKSVSNVGVTVPGSLSNQQFVNGDFFLTEGKPETIILHLLGVNEARQEVTRPITVDVKPVCSSCGYTNRPGAKFCQECGTSLQLVA